MKDKNIFHQDIAPSDTIVVSMEKLAELRYSFLLHIYRFDFLMYQYTFPKLKTILGGKVVSDFHQMEYW